MNIFRKSVSIMMTVCLMAAASETADAQQNEMQPAYTFSDTLCYVRTDSAAFLCSTFGGDRLGGNKMNFIDSNIVLKVTGQVADLYRVKLSGSRDAYIPKDMVTACDSAASSELFKLPALTSGFSVQNAGKEDKITIGINKRCPYIMWEEIEPHKLYVQVFGATLNSVWLTHRLNLEAVDNVDVRQTGSDEVTLVISLKNKTSWGYNVYYEGNTLNITVKHLPYFSLDRLVIGLDAGHGGSASGAVSRDGYKEKDLNMSMVWKLKKKLEAKGAKVVLSRDGDVNMTMQQRKEIFRDNNIDLLIAIHCNAGGRTAHGASTYYKHLVYKPLAQNILKSVTTLDGVHEFGLVGNFNFSLDAATNYPAVLLETMFLSWPDDVKLISNPDFQDKMMDKVVAGLKNFLKECKKAEK